MQDDYKGYVKNIPVLIKTNGLGNTLAFMLAKSSKKSGKEKNAYDFLYEHLAKWLRATSLHCEQLGQNQDLLAFVVDKDSHIYRQITTELLAVLKWMKRLAEAKLKDVSTSPQP